MEFIPNNQLVDQSSKNLDFRSQFEDEEIALLRVTNLDQQQLSSMVKFPISFRIKFFQKIYGLLVLQQFFILLLVFWPKNQYDTLILKLLVPISLLCIILIHVLLCKLINMPKILKIFLFMVQSAMQGYIARFMFMQFVLEFGQFYISFSSLQLSMIALYVILCKQDITKIGLTIYCSLVFIISETAVIIFLNITKTYLLFVSIQLIIQELLLINKTVNLVYMPEFVYKKKQEVRATLDLYYYLWGFNCFMKG